MVAEAVLLARFGSFCAVRLTVAVFVNIVTVFVDASRVTVASAPLLMLENVQVTVPDAHAQLPAVLETEAKVTAVGSVSVSVTMSAVPGPLLLTTIVYVRVSPRFTLLEAEILTAASALLVSITVVVAAIFVLLAALGSVVAEVADTESVMTVPTAVPEFTRTVIVKVVAAPLAKALVAVQVRTPPVGVGHVHPVVVPEITADSKVVFAGTL